MKLKGGGDKERTVGVYVVSFDHASCGSKWKLVKVAREGSLEMSAREKHGWGWCGCGGCLVRPGEDRGGSVSLFFGAVPWPGCI
jgi:hypothetical protein